MINPFQVLSPEQLSISKFKEIFVKEYTEVSMFESPKDFFIFGSRGSGKSMLLNYMELSHRLYYSSNNFDRFKEDSKDSKYLGIMVHATRHRLNTETYETLIKNQFVDPQFAKTVCSHDLIMAIMQRIAKTLTENQPIVQYLKNQNEVNPVSLCTRLLQKFDLRGLHSKDCFNSLSDPIFAFAELAEVFSKERGLISDYLSDKLQSKPNIFYSQNYSSFELLHDFVLEIKNLLKMPDYSLYILIDNADEMKNTMQICLNDLVRQREHNDICFKIAIKRGVNWDFGTIEEPHDYSSTTIDELYSASHTAYAQKIKEIAVKRFESAGITCSVEKFFPKSSQEEQLLNEIKKELKSKYLVEYEKTVTNVTKSDYIGNRVNKYAQAELFRRLGKTPKSYAGFDSLVHLSSGIVRQFLDLASKMFEEQARRSAGKSVTRIGLSVQNEVIKKYADEDIDNLRKKYQLLERSGITEKVEEARKYKHLFNLLEALGKLFKERLMDNRLKEPRVFTFTLIDQGAIQEVEDVLQLGVNGNYFQSYWYSTKSGLGKYPGYALNRKLCPRYVIDHTSFRGRIELYSAAIQNGMRKGEMPREISDSKNQKALTEFEGDREPCQ